MKTSKTAEKLAQKHGIDLSTVEGSGKNGNILVTDVQKVVDSAKVHVAEVVDDIALPKEKAPVNTTLRFFQMGKRKGEQVETFNYQFDFTKTGAVDMDRLAKFVAKTLFNLTDVMIRRNVKTSFSPSKPLWFEMNNGKEKVTLNLSVATKFKLFLKAKKGQNVRSQSEMVNDIQAIFEINDTLAISKL